MLDEPTCYLSPKLEGRKRTDGSYGVYATRPVLAQETLVVWGGEVVPADKLDQLSPDIRRYTLQIEEDLYLVTTHVGPADWINHACQPNAGLNGQVVLVALRDIAPGEEICYDYATSDGSPYDEFNCQCGSPHCRGRITGNDWTLPELQSKYAGYFSPYLQRRIQQLENPVYTNGYHKSNGLSA